MASKAATVFFSRPGSIWRRTSEAGDFDWASAAAVREIMQAASKRFINPPIFRRVEYTAFSINTVPFNNARSLSGQISITMFLNGMLGEQTRGLGAET